jgi:crotonobetaine/carnitine-CoA ligase
VRPDIPLEGRTLPAVWQAAVERAPDAPFLRWQGGALTYAAMEARVARIAAGLSGAGVERFSKVALMLSNSVEFVESWFAIARLGGVYVPINTEYKGAILSWQLNRADVSHIIIEAGFLDRLAAIADELVSLTTVIVVERETPARDVPGRLATRPYGALAEAGGPAPEPRIDYRDPMAISFTSGTTGPSKGVLATHCHVLSFSLDWISACDFRADDRLYSCLPMFHAIATWLGTVPAVLQGTSIAFSDRFSASRFWDDVRAFDATVVHGIFAMVPMLLKQPPRADDATVPARLFYIGQRNAEFETRFGCRIVEVYGATETGIVTCAPAGSEAPPGSCGKANAATYDVELVDDSDNPVPVGVAGEIVVRPRQPFSMIQEYYGMPAETLAAFRNLWFHTGDTAWRDADGWFHFADRKKDAMRRRGENISSWELERVVNADPRVAECAAIAHPSELGEDEVKMVIVVQPGADLDAQDVWGLCDERMPRFWVPRYLEFRESLPKTPNGKVQKYLLREGVGAGPTFDRLAGREAAA